MIRKKVTARKKKTSVKKKVIKKVAKNNKVSKKKITKKTVSKANVVKKPKPKVATSAPHPWLGKAVPSLKVHVVQAGSETRTINLQELVSPGLTVLYFYPKDDTPGCTTEACEFGDRLQNFKGVGARVIGVSPDGEASHLKFINKYNIPFALVSDPEKALCQKMALWKEKKFMGKTYMGVERATFLVQDGFVICAWQPVSVAGHVAEVHQKIVELKG